MKKADFIIIAAVAVIAGILVFFLYGVNNASGAYVQLEVDGKIVATLSLDEYNPYILTITEGHYYLSFKDGRGKQQNIEIDEMLYQTFDRFELEDISHLNRVSRHIEHSELTEETLNDRAFYKAKRIEDIVSESIEYEQLHRAVSVLPEV